MGAGIEMISLKPRTQSVVEDEVYKVDERVTALSYEVHMKYTSPLWYVAAKVFGFQSYTSIHAGRIRCKIH